MGSSMQLAVHPEIPYYDRVVSSIFLQFKQPAQTQPLLHKCFLKELAKSHLGNISRQCNPFCPLTIQDSSNWITCCFISPFMLIALPPLLQTKSTVHCQEFSVKLQIHGNQKELKLKKAICIEENCLYLLLLQKPFFQLGWAGLSAINLFDEQKEKLMKINHPQYYLDRDKNQMTHRQVMEPYRGNLKQINSNNKLESQQDLIGTIIFKLIDNKPFIVGLQTLKGQTKFLSEHNLKEMHKACIEHLKDVFNQQQLLQTLNQGIYKGNEYF